MKPVLRSALLLVVLVVAALIVVAHGVRGAISLIVVVLALSLPRTAAWRAVERPLVRFTGSRQRAYVLTLALVLGLLAVINVYEYVR